MINIEDALHIAKYYFETTSSLDAISFQVDDVSTFDFKNSLLTKEGCTSHHTSLTPFDPSPYPYIVLRNDLMLESADMAKGFDILAEFYAKGLE